MAETMQAGREPEWKETHRIDFDSSVLFSPGYDWGSYEWTWEELHAPHGAFAVWSSGGRGLWSAYGGPEGALMFERFATADEAKAWAERELAALESPHAG